MGLDHMLELDGEAHLPDVGALHAAVELLAAF